MKREIRFRVWAGKSIIKSESYISLSHFFDAVYGYELMQYTGLKDKNGTEIYEGDILGFEVIRNFKEEYVHKFVVTWDYENAGWIQFSPKNKVVILGNIHENPELLNQ